MAFAGVNYGAILIAALAAWFTGAIWYGVFSKPWVAALGKTMDTFQHEQAAKTGSPQAYTPFILAFLANLLMAWVLAGLISHLGPNPFTLHNGLISAAFVWLGFVVTTMAVTNAFSGRKAALTVIDAGHWLAALIVMGAIIGAMGI